MTPWTVAHQALLSVGFPRQEYWGGLPFPPPGDLPDPGIEPMSFVSLSMAWQIQLRGEKFGYFHSIMFSSSLFTSLGRTIHDVGII